MMQDRYVKNALILTNNRVIFDEYDKGHDDVFEIRTTTLSESDFFKREDTCKNVSIKLAYAGRIEPTKGIDDMLDAITLLRREGIKAELHIAGWDPSVGEKYLKKLRQKVDDEGLSEAFAYHGKKQLGEDLFDFYRSCDIFVIATKGNEGFPRTIWEAMAQSMPVIASRVGAIPNMLEDANTVLLIDQGSPRQLAESVARLQGDIKLRQKLIENGYALAKTNTIEIQSKNMADIMKRYKNAVKAL